MGPVSYKIGVPFSVNAVVVIRFCVKISRTFV